jgi:hypothetical protein
MELLVGGVVERHNGGMAGRLRYSDVRPIVLPDAFDTLAGPTSGVVELPTRLAWSGLRSFDLGDDRQLGMLYETVIREAMSTADLAGYLNTAILRRIWHRIWLPTGQRQAWVPADMKKSGCADS